jgi:hypothetical protein
MREFEVVGGYYRGRDLRVWLRGYEVEEPMTLTKKRVEEEADIPVRRGCAFYQSSSWLAVNIVWENLAHPRRSVYTSDMFSFQTESYRLFLAIVEVLAQPLDIAPSLGWYI